MLVRTPQATCLLVRRAPALNATRNAVCRPRRCSIGVVPLQQCRALQVAEPPQGPLDKHAPELLGDAVHPPAHWMEEKLSRHGTIVGPARGPRVVPYAMTRQPGIVALNQGAFILRGAVRIPQDDHIGQISCPTVDMVTLPVEDI